MKNYHHLTLEEKAAQNPFYKIGLLIGKKLRESGATNYGALDNYFRFQQNALKESGPDGQITTDILWFSPEIQRAGMPERIEIKFSERKFKALAWKDRFTGESHLKEVVEGKEIQNGGVLPKLLAGVFASNLPENIEKVERIFT